MLIHFEFRADSLSGDTDTVTVEARWIKGSGAAISLGTFTSAPATATGDAPWKEIEIDATETVRVPVGRLEINRVSGEDNAHIRNVWVSLTSTLYAFGTTENWKWTYVAGGAGAGFQSPSFDDSSWATGMAAFGRGGSLPWGYRTTLPSSPVNGDVLLRKAFDVSSDKLVRVRYMADDNVTLWWNGTQFYTSQGQTAHAHEAWIWVPQELIGGSNLLAVRGRDEYGVNLYVDVEVEVLGPKNYGSFPQKYPYTADVQDGVFEGIPILNDGGSPGQEYFAETGEPVDPSDFNYEIWFGGHAGSRVDELDNWLYTGARWMCNTDAAYQSGREDQGTPNLNFFGRDWYTALRPDGFTGAPHHHIHGVFSTYGSRGMSDIGPIWGWNSWNDFFFALSGGHGVGGGGVFRMLGGVVTVLSTTRGGSNEILVQHDFLTGELHVEWIDYFMGGHIHYNGIHPHTVGAGHAGWIADRQDSSLGFWDTTLSSYWSNIFEPGHIAHQQQFSMQDLMVVEHDPPTWYFDPATPPPLRQRVRDDGLGIDSRQEKGQGSSQQLSLRRGGRVYY